MSRSFFSALEVLSQCNIQHTVGAESLVGLVEGDLFKYTHHLRLYIFPPSRPQIIRLAFRLLQHGIILKPKSSQGKRFYKLRYKPSLFKKESVFIHIAPITKVDAGNEVFIGGHHTFFPDEDLSIESLNKVKVNDHSLSVPADHEGFVRKYRTELLSGFYQKHEVQFDSESERQAVKFMHENVKVMNESGIDFWIEGGTLLGALRDKKLIPWDHDLDFGMKYTTEEQMKRLIRKLRRHFYVSVRSFPKTSKIWQLGKYRVLKIFPRKNFIFKEDLCLDLFVYYEGKLPDSNEVVYKYVVWDRNAYHRKEFLDNIESIEFYGGEVPVPGNPEKFIEVKYGENWRTPIKEWNVALDDGSIYEEN